MYCSGVLISCAMPAARLPMASRFCAWRRASSRWRGARRAGPRRPAWSRGPTPAQLDAAERSSFLAWRRDLAELEGEEALVLTPFEKNLEIWRQLWRVLERSDAVVQVLDARDPLTYACPDLDAYAREIHATKTTLLLLNKADLLPPALRLAWADHFEARGARYAFWSAKAATEAAAADEEGELEGCACLPEPAGAGEVEPRARLLTVQGLLDLLQRVAQEAVAEAAMLGIPRVRMWVVYGWCTFCVSAVGWVCMDFFR